MKIKTITCHNVYNFGASLQAYALMTYLTSQGHQVEIIDYMPDYIRKNLSLWAIGPKWNRNIFIKCAFYCYVIPIRIMQSKSRKKFDKYTRKYLHLTQRYNSFQELLNNPPEADIYFCGSASSGCTALTSRMTEVSLSGSMMMEVPVYPVCP